MLIHHSPPSPSHPSPCPSPLPLCSVHPLRGCEQLLSLSIFLLFIITIPLHHSPEPCPWDASWCSKPGSRGEKQWGHSRQSMGPPTPSQCCSESFWWGCFLPSGLTALLLLLSLGLQLLVSCPRRVFSSHSMRGRVTPSCLLPACTPRALSPLSSSKAKLSRA